MKENLKIAWRNLWRNKRRTTITISSIFFAVFFSILMRSFQLGTYENMLNNIVTQFSGHIQIQDKEYFDNPTLDYSIAMDKELLQKLQKMPQVTNYVPRLQLGGLAAKNNASRIAFVYGVDIEKENQLSLLYKRIVHFILDTAIVDRMGEIVDDNLNKKLQFYYNKPYTSIENALLDLKIDGFDTTKISQIIRQSTKIDYQNINVSSNEILIGYDLAQYLEANIADSIVIFGQGFEGSNAVGVFKVAGLLKFPNEGFNSRIIYMPLGVAQKFANAYKINNENDTTFFASYISINTIYKAGLDDDVYKNIENICQHIQQSSNDTLLRAIGWQTLNKDLYRMLKFDNVAGMISSYVLYLIIAFGVLGTIMMMVAERKREFGVMMAIGLKRSKLSIIVATEMFIMGFISFILGLVVTAPIIYFGYNNPIVLHGQQAQGMAEYNIEPILKFGWFGSYIWQQLIIVTFMVAIISLYAFWKINKMKVIEALRA